MKEELETEKEIRKGKYREKESWREMRVSCHMVVKGVNLSK